MLRTFPEPNVKACDRYLAVNKGDAEILIQPIGPIICSEMIPHWLPSKETVRLPDILSRQAT